MLNGSQKERKKEKSNRDHHLSRRGRPHKTRGGGFALLPGLLLQNLEHRRLLLSALLPLAPSVLILNVTK